ncbi:MAG: alpha/beta fold hydrolase [Flavobacteriaceae bacterium]
MIIRIIILTITLSCLNGGLLIQSPDRPQIIYAPNPIDLILGQWEGVATTTTEQTRLILELQHHKNVFSASISLMDMGVMGWPAKDVQLKGGELTLRFPTDNSEQILVLKLVDNGNGEAYLKGSWQDTSLEELAEIRLYKQESEPSYKSTEISVEGPEGTLSAEVVLPEGKGPYPGVIFLHGSGPQPKDTNRFSAFALAEEGIASIIFDKRGVAGSSGNWQGADFEELARDGIAVARHFLAMEEIEFVGFFGHSQGGWIGPLAATLFDETKFVISSAGPAVSPAREAQWSFIYNAKIAGAEEEDIRLIRQVVDHWHDGLRTAEWKPYRSSLELARAEAWFDAAGLGYLQYPPDPEQLKYYLPFMDYDPIPVLMELDVPLFALLTPDDESIDALETEVILMELKTTGKDIRVKMYPGYNHGFRRIEAGRQIRWPGFPEDYFKLQAEFIKGIKTSNER